MSRLDELLAHKNIRGALVALIVARASRERDAALMRVTAGFAGMIRAVRPAVHVLLRLATPPDADRWDDALQLAGYQLEAPGIPMLEPSADPHTGDAVSGKVDEASIVAECGF